MSEIKVAILSAVTLFRAEIFLLSLPMEDVLRLSKPPGGICVFLTPFPAQDAEALMDEQDCRAAGWLCCSPWAEALE